MLFELKNVDLEAMQLESKSSKYTFDTKFIFEDLSRENVLS